MELFRVVQGKIRRRRGICIRKYQEEMDLGGFYTQWWSLVLISSLVGALLRISRLFPCSLYNTLVDRYNWTKHEAASFASFLLPMLEYTPDKRTTAVKCLQHPWLSSQYPDQACPSFGKWLLLEVEHRKVYSTGCRTIPDGESVEDAIHWIHSGTRALAASLPPPSLCSYPFTSFHSPNTITQAAFSFLSNLSSVTMHPSLCFWT